MWFKRTLFLFISWHKIAALRLVTHGGGEGMLEGCKRYHLSPLSDAFSCSRHFMICCILRPSILKLMKINLVILSLSYDSSLAAKPMADCGEQFCQHWDVCCVFSWLCVLWGRPWCLTPNPLLAGSKYLPEGTYSIGLCCLDEELQGGLPGLAIFCER